jgi:two-component system response regulator
MVRDQVTHILLVDDSDSDAELTLQILRKSSASCLFTRVHDGVEALEFLFREGAFHNREGGTPSLILLDLKMPRVDGLEVLQTLKSDDLTRAIPVVVLTSSSDPRNVTDTKLLGAAGYLMKPVSVADLMPWLE